MQVSDGLSFASRQLNFPEGRGSFVQRGIDGDSVVLTSSNQWSRRIDHGFRMHSSRSLTAPASLRWAQVPLAGLAHRLVFSAKIAVDYSLPAFVMLRASADEKLVGAWSAEVNHAGVNCELLIPKGFELLSLEVEVIRFFDLTGGEVSVIDIAPIELHQHG